MTQSETVSGNLVVNDDYVMRMNIYILVIVILLILLTVLSNRFSELFNVFSKLFASVMITILTYIIWKWYKSENIKLFEALSKSKSILSLFKELLTWYNLKIELLEALCILFILQSFIYVVLNVAIRQVVDLEKKVPQSIFRICIASIFAVLWISFASVIWRNELNYVILIPVSISFIVFMLTSALKLANQEIPQNDYSTKIMNTLDRYNSTPLQLIINLHLWCFGVYLFHEMLV